MGRSSLKRKVAINLGLTALVGVLVILVVLEPGHEPPPSPPPLTDLAPGDLSTVVIEQPEQPTIRLERAEAGWRMIEPRSLRASPGKVDDLLAIVQAQSHQRYDAAAIDPAEAGLADPRATLSVDGTRLVFGDTDPIEGQRYVQLGESVHLIGGRYLSRLRNEPLYWADNALLPDGATITAIELPGVVLTRDEQGLWHAEPDAEDVSADAPVRLANAWGNARALSVKAAPAEIPADADRIRIRLEERKAPIVFHQVDIRTGFELIREDLGISYTMTGPQRAELLELQAAEPAAADDEFPGAGGPEG